MSDTAAESVQVVPQPVTSIPSRLMGRTRIFTDLTHDELSDEAKLRKDLGRALGIHAENARAIRYLQRYYLAQHPAILTREKRVRPDVDNRVVVDYAYAFTRDITGYFLGKNVRYVHRATFNAADVAEPPADRPGESSNAVDDTRSAAMLNEQASEPGRREVERLTHIFDIENKNQVDLEVATDMSINGVGYKGLFVESSPRNGTHLHLRHLNPETTFVVYSAGDILEPMYAVSYWSNNPVDAAEAATYVRVYTPTKQFDYKTHGDLTSFGAVGATGLETPKATDIDLGGYLPIVEYRNNAYALGDWEMAITLMDAIDTLASDGVNDIEQFVQSVLVAIGLEFNEETQATLNNIGVLNIPQLPPGMPYPPELRYITPQLDAESGASMRDYIEATLRVIVGVPDRKTRGGGGGDTGDAVFLRDGWQDIDLVAANKESSFVLSEREALNVALYILKTYDEIGELTSADVEIKFNRNKSSNAQSKVQVLQTLWNMLDPADALELSDLTTNVQDVIIRAEKAQQKRLENQLEEQRRVSEVAAQFKEQDDGQQVNTGSQKKETGDE